MTDTNELTGTIPTELGRLTNLTYLFLTTNNLHGTIPTQLAAIKNLGMLCFALILVLNLMIILLITATLIPSTMFRIPLSTKQP